MLEAVSAKRADGCGFDLAGKKLMALGHWLFLVTFCLLTTVYRRAASESPVQISMPFETLPSRAAEAQTVGKQVVPFLAVSVRELERQ